MVGEKFESCIPQMAVDQRWRPTYLIVNSERNEPPEKRAPRAESKSLLTIPPDFLDRLFNSKLSLPELFGKLSFADGKFRDEVDDKFGLSKAILFAVLLTGEEKYSGDLSILPMLDFCSNFVSVVVVLSVFCDSALLSRKLALESGSVLLSR